MGTHHLTTAQQVWLAAWTAAVQSGKYNPENEADACLKAFNEKFIPKKTPPPEKKHILLEAPPVQTP